MSDETNQVRGTMKKSLALAQWEKLLVLGEKQGAIRLKDLSSEMKLTEEETLAFLRQMFPDGVGVEIYHKKNESWVDLNAEAIRYMLPLSCAEWLQLHYMLTTKKFIENEATQSLRKKVTESGAVKVMMQLFEQLDHWDQELSDLEQKFVHELDLAINAKYLIELSTNKRNYVVHPCKVLHLEGNLSLIAEDSQDHCLSVIPLRDVVELKNIPSTALPKVTSFEVEEFIMAIRSMNEKETRLILKIHDPGSTNLFPDHHFLGKPCMVTNPNGDLIWAAYVEPCEALYDWLVTLGKKVEILDPVRFREDYLSYCEEKLRKIA